MNNAKKGFTLVELLVVIAILAILATVSVVGYTSFINRAHESNAQTEAHQIESTIESYTMIGEAYILTDAYAVKLVDVDDTTAVKMELRVFEYTTDDGKVVIGDQVDDVTTDIKAGNADFKDLPGKLTIDGGVLVYTGANTTTGIEIK